MAECSQQQEMQVINSVKNWINNVIVALNFCPFAKKEMQQNTVQYTVCHADKVDASLEQLIDELTRLDKNPSIQTSLLIFTQGFQSFEDYLDLVDYATGLIAQGGYAGIYQLATFHPHYCFADEPVDDPANYTNRSPYPILHILREASIEQVLKRYPEPENIPTNNINKARELGSTTLAKLLAQS